MEFVSALHPPNRRLPAAWLLLALGALAVSTLCAVLLVAARAPLPLLTGVAELFGRALVLHVSLAIVVWFLACAAGFWTLMAGASRGFWRWSGLILAASGSAAMVLSLFAPSAQPVLANYIPVLAHPLFLTGLVAFGAGIALTAAANLPALLQGVGQAPLWRIGALLSLVAVLVAFASLIASLVLGGAPQDARGFERLAWAPGHVLQFAHVLLVMGVWAWLAKDVPGGRPETDRTGQVLFVLAALPLLAVPVIHALHPVESDAFRRAFTLLMAWGLWPAAAIFGARIAWRVLAAGGAEHRSSTSVALLLSIALFFIGCALGALIRNDTTMVPAHYHGTVGAITLAYMALAYRLLPLFGRAVPTWRMVRWQPVMYGAGLTVLALALAWSGLLGVPRKTVHANVMMAYPAYLGAMGLAGIGGALAVSGAAMFIVNMLRAMRPARPRGRKRDVRFAALAATAVLTVAVGLLIQLWPAQVKTIVANPELDRHFGAGVRLLAARDYDAAAVELHQLLMLAPRMPEAHVNMGFALIGLNKPAQARDAFAMAIELRRDQMNAYYGLAVALEALGDLPGAVAAMRSFVHRSLEDDPYRRRAEAAIWEWEDALGRARLAEAAVPEVGNGAHAALKHGKGVE